MFCLIQSLQSFSLRQFQKWNFRRYEPSKDVAEQRIISEWYYVLNFPENRSWVPAHSEWLGRIMKNSSIAAAPVVVMAERDVLCARPAAQEPLHMLEEPWLVPVADVVELSRGAAVHHAPRHHHGALQREHQTLHEVCLGAGGGVHALHLPLEGLDHLVQGVDGGVVQLHEALAGHDVDLHADEEAEGAVAPGDGVEQVRVIVGGAGHHGAIGQHQLETKLQINISNRLRENYLDPRQYLLQICWNRP